MKETYEIKAVDLNLTDSSIEALNICEYVPVISRPHGINGKYLLTKADIHIAEPQNSMFYLGSTKRVFSDKNSGGTVAVSVPKNISSFRNDAGYISEEKTEEMLSDYIKSEDVEEMVSQAVSQIPGGENGLSAYETAVIYGFEGTEEEWLASLNGADGEDGFSPTITENAENNEEIYKLDITTKDGSFTTPNLKGMDGKDGIDSDGGLSGQEVSDMIDTAIFEITSGARIAKNAKGEWGYIPPGADAVIPFSRECEGSGISSDFIERHDISSGIVYGSAIIELALTVTGNKERVTRVNIA